MYLKTVTALFVLIICGAAAASAQETPAPVSPAPAASPTLMDRQYDGALHVELAPYVWLPTVHGNYQYSIPTIPGRKHGVVESSVAVTPTDYAANLNSAAMFAFDARKGNIDLFGDYIYTNASASATVNSSVSGRFGRVQIPVSLTTNARLASSIWEAALGFTLGHGHNADLSTFIGVRNFPVNLTLDYNATIGKKGILAPSGTVTSSETTADVIWGLRGKAYLGDGHWYVPYYFDVGTAVGQVSNQTWEGYGGAGYAFNHGQTILLVYRDLSYYGFAPSATVQRLTFSGPLIGYTFNL